jgi:hypothetical protein
VVAQGDRLIERDEVVELADAVATSGGIASGIGTTRYGAQLIVHARSSEEAVALARTEFVRAAAKAGLPAWPITRAEAVSEDDDADELG